MKTEIRKVEGEIVVIIPDEIVQHLGLYEGTTVILRLLGDEILLKPLDSPEDAAVDVEKGVTPQSSH